MTLSGVVLDRELCREHCAALSVAIKAALGVETMIIGGQSVVALAAEPEGNYTFGGGEFYDVGGFPGIEEATCQALNSATAAGYARDSEALSQFKGEILRGIQRREGNERFSFALVGIGGLAGCRLVSSLDGKSATAPAQHKRNDSHAHAHVQPRSLVTPSFLRELSEEIGIPNTGLWAGYTQGDLPSGIPLGQPCPVEFPAPVTGTTTFAPTTTLSPSPSPSPPSSLPPSPSTTPTPTASDEWEQEMQVYLEDGCKNMDDDASFCVQYLGAASYCKTWQEDECGRSVCQGGQFLLPCDEDVAPPSPSPTTTAAAGTTTSTTSTTATTTTAAAATTTTATTMPTTTTTSVAQEDNYKLCESTLTLPSCFTHES